MDKEYGSVMYVAHPLPISIPAAKDGTKHSADSDVQFDWNRIPGSVGTLENCLFKQTCYDLWSMIRQPLIFVDEFKPLRGIEQIILIDMNGIETRIQRFFDRMDVFTLTTFLQGPLTIAADNYLTKWNGGLERLFSKNSFRSDRSIISHAIVQYHIWLTIANTTNQRFFVAYDDTSLVDGVREQWNAMIRRELIPNSADIIFLGNPLGPTLPLPKYTSIVTEGAKTFNAKAKQEIISHFLLDDRTSADQSSAWVSWPMSRSNLKSFNSSPQPFMHIDGYVLSSKGAQSLCKFLDTFGWRRPADHHLLRLAATPGIGAIFLDPPLAEFAPPLPRIATNGIQGGPDTEKREAWLRDNKKKATGT